MSKVTHNKKALKVFILINLFLILILSLFFFYMLIVAIPYKLDENKLINSDKKLFFYDENENEIDSYASENQTVKISELPEYVKGAFISIEDKRFYYHNGTDKRAILRAFFNNLKSFSFKEGASTISQQLIKNTHLSSEKTLKRKAIEIKLTRQLEKKYSKNEILEMYLNTIYFGHNSYGIVSASKYYFNKKPSKLSINESAVLASIIKAPSVYSPKINAINAENRKNTVLKEMYNQRYITKEEYDKNADTPISLKAENDSFYNYIDAVKDELDGILINKSYYKNQLKIITYYDKNLQNSVENSIKTINNDQNASFLILDDKSKVKAYASTTFNTKRNVGSVIKPILVYAPAINENIITPYSKIVDEKTDFNGYSPSNYNDVYYGETDVKTALSKSLNVPTIKILNRLGVEKAIDYLNKFGIETTEQDKNLSIGLGDIPVSFFKISSTYSAFINDGNYYDYKLIKEIIDEKGNVIYKDSDKKIQIFSSETAFYINDMLKCAVKNGTSKKLNNLNTAVYAKTGTVGNENGNTDAYCISYNKDYIVANWIGNKKNTLLENKITGGNTCADNLISIWNSAYKTKTDGSISKPDSIEEIFIDKIAYDSEGIIEIAEDIAPKKYKTAIFVNKNKSEYKKSTRFSVPKIEKQETSINNKGFSVRLCLPQYYDAEIYRVSDGKKIKVYDTINNNRQVFNDYNLKSGKSYEYYIVPYYVYNGKTYYGDEMILSKIKSPNNSFDDFYIDDYS